MKICSEIFEEREQTCERCGKYIVEAKWHNFSHNNGRETETKCMDKNNIELLCFSCHHEKDFGTKTGEWLN